MRGDVKCESVVTLSSPRARWRQPNESCAVSQPDAGQSLKTPHRAASGAEPRTLVPRLDVVKRVLLFAVAPNIQKMVPTSVVQACAGMCERVANLRCGFVFQVAGTNESRESSTRKEAPKTKAGCEGPSHPLLLDGTFIRRLQDVCGTFARSESSCRCC